MYVGFRAVPENYRLLTRLPSWRKLGQKRLTHCPGKRKIRRKWLLCEGQLGVLIPKPGIRQMHSPRVGS